MSNKLLTTSETLKMLNISRPTLYDWMERGILKPVDMYPARFKRRPKLMFREQEVKALAPAESIEQEETELPKNENKPAVPAA